MILNLLLISIFYSHKCLGKSGIADLYNNAFSEALNNTAMEIYPKNHINILEYLRMYMKYIFPTCISM